MSKSKKSQTVDNSQQLRDELAAMELRLGNYEDALRMCIPMYQASEGFPADADEAAQMVFVAEQQSTLSFWNDQKSDIAKKRKAIRSSLLGAVNKAVVDGLADTGGWVAEQVKDYADVIAGGRYNVAISVTFGEDGAPSISINAALGTVRKGTTKGGSSENGVSYDGTEFGSASKLLAHVKTLNSDIDPDYGKGASAVASILTLVRQGKVDGSKIAYADANKQSDLEAAIAG